MYKRRWTLCANKVPRPPLDHLGQPMTILGEAFDRELRIREDPVITAGVAYVEVQ